MIVSIPTSGKKQTQLTVSFITSLKDSSLSSLTLVRGKNTGGSTDLSDGAMVKMKISTLRMNIVSLWGECFIPLGLYVYEVGAIRCDQ
jgi:hypothetical protein